MSGSRVEYRDGRFWDENGEGWSRVNDFVQPEAADHMLRQGARWLVEWCERLPEVEPENVLRSEVMPNLANRTAHRKAMRKKKSKTMFMAEEWRNDSGNRLLIFVEGPPAPRSDRHFD